jgi:hypothetical protein
MDFVNMDLEKLPHEKLSGEISIDEMTIECYHLDNNMRVISGRGLQKILGLNTMKSGNRVIEAYGNKHKTYCFHLKIIKIVRIKLPI